MFRFVLVTITSAGVKSKYNQATDNLESLIVKQNDVMQSIAASNVDFAVSVQISISSMMLKVTKSWTEGALKTFSENVKQKGMANASLAFVKEALKIQDSLMDKTVEMYKLRDQNKRREKVTQFVARQHHHATTDSVDEQLTNIRKKQDALREAVSLITSGAGRLTSQQLKLDKALLKMSQVAMLQQYGTVEALRKLKRDVSGYLRKRITKRFKNLSNFESVKLEQRNHLQEALLELLDDPVTPDIKIDMDETDVRGNKKFIWLQERIAKIGFDNEREKSLIDNLKLKLEMEEYRNKALLSMTETLASQQARKSSDVDCMREQKGEERSKDFLRTARLAQVKREVTQLDLAIAVLSSEMELQNFPDTIISQSKTSSMIEDTCPRPTETPLVVVL